MEGVPGARPTRSMLLISKGMKDDPGSEDARTFTRRSFLRTGSLWLVGGVAGCASLGPRLRPRPGAGARVRVALITDLHYADKAPLRTRHYRETPAKLAEAAEGFRAARPDLLVELGDVVDAAPTVEEEKGYLRTILRQIREIPGEHHYVLGNHCVSTLTKPEFLDGVERTASYYSFDRSGWHFVVLDSCFRSDGVPYGRNNFEWTDPNVPAAELEWLRADLADTSSPTVVFAHQRLDEAGQHAVRNNAEVRRILEGSGRVSAVFQGHSHENDYQHIGGIHYCTLVAMVEGSGAANNGYSILDLLDDGVLRLRGFRRQASRDWSRGG